MNINIIKNNLKYYSLVLVISFFLIHKILLVIIGIIISLYEINKDNINSTILNLGEDNEGINKSSSFNKLESDYINNYKSENMSQTRLVEIVDEIGFIPSIDKDKYDEVV